MNKSCVSKNKDNVNKVSAQIAYSIENQHNEYQNTHPENETV